MSEEAKVPNSGGLVDVQVRDVLMPVRRYVSARICSMTWSIILTAMLFLSMRVSAVSFSRTFVKVLPVKSLCEICRTAGKQENMWCTDVVTFEKIGTWFKLLNILSRKLFRPTASRPRGRMSRSPMAFLMAVSAGMVWLSLISPGRCRNGDSMYPAPGFCRVRLTP